MVRHWFLAPGIVGSSPTSPAMRLYRLESVPRNIISRGAFCFAGFSICKMLWRLRAPFLTLYLI